MGLGRSLVSFPLEVSSLLNLHSVSRIEYIDIVGVSQGYSISRQFMSVTSTGLISLVAFWG